MMGLLWYNGAIEERRLWMLLIRGFAKSQSHLNGVCYTYNCIVSQWEYE